MFSLGKYKLFKHSKIFDDLYNEACKQLISEKTLTQNDISHVEKSIKKCKFEEKILFYQKDNQIIGFCIYDIIDDYCIVILDFVQKKYKGGGRKCRELFAKEFKNKKGIKLSVNINNFNSFNSLNRLEKSIGKFFLHIKKETRIDFPDHIFITLVNRP